MVKLALALLLCAPTAYADAPIVRLAPSPLVLTPFALGAGPAALQFSAPSLALSAPSLALPVALTPALLPAPAIAAPLAVNAQRPVAALPVLAALTVLPAPAIGDAWDGSGRREEANEEAYAHVEQRRREAEAVQYAHAEIPVVDYRRGAYGEERAKEFMEGVYVVDDKTKFTGLELLSFLVTPEALRADQIPDPARVDFARLGKNSAQIRETLAEKGMPYHPYERVLTEAFRDGLIYRLTDARNGMTYHGVPHEVRAAFGLEAKAPEPAKAEDVAPAGPTPFSVALTKLAKEAESLPHREELFEFTAQVVAAAIKAGKLPPDAVSPAFKARAAKIDFDVTSLKEALLTLAESAEGTPWEGRAADLQALAD
jgi:hypothetical protein